MNPAIKKKVLRRFTYGLYIVTVTDGEDVNGFTANWLSQSSFEPPMLTLALENDARSLPMILNSRTFAVNVVPQDGRELAGKMGRSSRQNPSKLADVEYSWGTATGSPILAAAAGWVECRLVGTLPSGDHMLLLGEIVEAGEGREIPPLTHSEAGFRYSG